MAGDDGAKFGKQSVPITLIPNCKSQISGSELRSSFDIAPETLDGLVDTLDLAVFSENWLVGL